MEGSFVKLKIAEKEEKLKIDREKTIKKPINGIVQKDGKYYLVRLEMELEKLKYLINEVERVSRLAQIPEEASGIIRNAVGKAQLLITKKFKQFEDLCRDNIEDNPEKRLNELETKSSDLQGYWEMMFIQIEEVKMMFNDIEKMEANNWKTIEGEAGNSFVTNCKDSPKNKQKPSNKSNKSSTRTKNRVKSKNMVNDEKVKRDAKNRLAAIRKQAKLRQQEEAESISINGTLQNDNVNLLLNNNVLSESFENGSKQGKLCQHEEAESISNSINDSLNKENVNVLLNNNVPLRSSENLSFNADASLNSSLNSSLEGLYENSCDSNPSPPTIMEEETG